MNTDELYQVAVHEAGHAVMSVICGRGLEYVTITPKGRAVGECKNTDIVTNADDSEEMIGLRMLKEVLVLSAGTVAEMVILGLNLMDTRGKDDFDKANEILEAPNDGLLNERSQDATKRTFGIIGSPLAQLQIKAVADKLMEHKRLSGEEVERIMLEVAA